ncbi:PAS domain S-box protein [Haloarculaceae archaeon H-GB11]|nr:PAS domain S-box protein [Haloarculaceae archaeon H-GB11]
MGETRLAPVVVDDEVTQIVGSTRNITDQKERERRLQKFEKMVEHTGHAVFFTDVDGQIEYVNPAFEDLTGYTSADALGETPDLLSSGEHDEAFFANLWETVLDGNIWSGEIVNECKDGTRFVANHTIAPVTDDSGDVTDFVAIYDDITERKERERRLQTHELVVQTINEVAFLVDEDKRIRFANDAALDFADEPREAIEGLPIGPITEEMAAPDEDPRRFLDAIDALLDDVEPEVGSWIREPKGSKTLSFEFDLSLESIGDIHTEQRLVPVELYDGARGVAVISRDVTARTESEQTIKTHLEQAQSIGTVGSWHLVFDDHTLYWSDECYRMFGIQPDQTMTYERFLDSVHPEDRERLDEAWNAALEGAPYEIEHRIVVGDEVKWVRETADITFDDDGEPVEGVGVVKDITDRREREREIIEQKRRYESLFNSVGGAIVVTDLDGYITTCNPGFTDLFGYDSTDVAGTHLSTIIDECSDLERLLETTDARRESLLVDYKRTRGRSFRENHEAYRFELTVATSVATLFI